MLDLARRVSKLDFVLDQLRMYSGKKKLQGTTSTFVICPFHSEKSPSGRIFHSPTTKNPGYFKCYGCGTNVPWDEVAPKLGLKSFVPPKPRDDYAREIKFELETTANETSKGEIQYVGKVPPNKRWRNIPTNLLLELGVYKCAMYYPDSDYTTEPYLYFPCSVRGKERGFIRARMRKVKDKPSYLNSSGPWSLKFGFFPLDYAIRVMKASKKKTIVLVEGPRDALRLLSLGIPAVAILGTQSWSEAKSRILDLCGVEAVVLFMDSDKAGIDAAKRLKKFLNPMFHVVVEKIPESEHEWDPGNAPLWVIKHLRRRLKCLP